LSNLTIRRGLVLAAGLVLLLLPLFVRAAFWGYHRRPYAPSELPSFSVAATPQPTVTPWAQTPPPSQAKQELRPGPVIVDMAHGNRVSRNQFEPLAAALVGFLILHMGIRLAWKSIRELIDTGLPEEELERLRRENERLSRKLGQAELIMDIQKKVAAMLGHPIETPPNSEATS